jgi:hypothetical protein
VPLDPPTSQPPTTKVSLVSPPAPIAEKAGPVRETVPVPREVVIEMVAKDPFLSISEIKRELARKHPDLRLGWWSIWGILRRESLLSKKNRFRRARLKSGGN